MEVVTINHAASEILKASGNTTVTGFKIPAKIIKRLIEIGRDGV
jgi:hypothetical protein